MAQWASGCRHGVENRHAANSWSHLISPSYHIPLGASARVSFDHYICAEVGWDGGALYTSIDNGPLGKSTDKIFHNSMIFNIE